MRGTSVSVDVRIRGDRTLAECQREIFPRRPQPGEIREMRAVGRLRLPGRILSDRPIPVRPASKTAPNDAPTVASGRGPDIDITRLRVSRALERTDVEPAPGRLVDRQRMGRTLHLSARVSPRLPASSSSTAAASARSTKSSRAFRTSPSNQTREGSDQRRHEQVCAPRHELVNQRAGNARLDQHPPHQTAPM